MPDYQKLLDKDEELLKTFKKIRRDSNYVYSESRKLLYIIFDDEPEFVYILPNDYKQDELAQYCRKIVSKEAAFAIIKKLPYGENSVLFIRKDLSEFEFPHRLFFETYSSSIDKHSFLDLFVNTVAGFSWLGRYIYSPISNSIYIIDDSKEGISTVVNNITDIKYKFDKETKKMIVSKIKLNFGTTDFWISIYDYNLTTAVNNKFSHVPDGREALKLNNRKRNAMRRAIEQNVKKYGTEFVEEFKSLTDEEILQLILTGKIPSIKLKRKKDK